MLPKIISGSAFLPTIFNILGWKHDSRYKIIGTSQSNNDDILIFFDLKDAVLLINEDELSDNPESILESDEIKPSKRKRKIKAYPAQWADSFGDKYYESQIKSQTEVVPSQDWDIDDNQVTYSTDSEPVTTKQEAANQIKDILRKIGANDE